MIIMSEEILASRDHFTSKAQIELGRSSAVTKYTFMDYITGGMEMNFVVAIDYTASNLDPANPNSLHFNHGSTPNQYVQV